MFAQDYSTYEVLIAPPSKPRRTRRRPIDRRHSRPRCVPFSALGKCGGGEPKTQYAYRATEAASYDLVFTKDSNITLDPGTMAAFRAKFHARRRPRRWGASRGAAGKFGRPHRSLFDQWPCALLLAPRCSALALASARHALSQVRSRRAAASKLKQYAFRGYRDCDGTRPARLENRLFPSHHRSRNRRREVCGNL